MRLRVVGGRDDPNTRSVGVVTAQQLYLEVQLVVAVLDTGSWGTPGVGMIPANQAQMFPVQLLVYRRLQSLGGLGVGLAGLEEAGEGGGDGQVVRVGVPVAGQVAAHLTLGQVGVKVQHQHGRGRH